MTLWVREIAKALEQSAKQTKFQAKQTKQEGEIYKIKFNRKENRYSQPQKR